MRLAADGRAALDHLVEHRVDAIVLDVAMPGVDGVEVCRRLRSAGDRTPVLMLTARDAIDDRVAGLDAGADDYLVKPFALKELQARLRALLRRAEPDGAGLVRFADLELDPVAREVRRGARRIELSRTEFALLELFLAHPRQVLSRSEIFERVWGYDFGSTSNALGVYVGYLRRKTEAGGRAAPPAHRARRRLPPARGVVLTLRRRLAADHGGDRGRDGRVAAGLCFLVVRDDLRDQVDDALTEQGRLLDGPGGARLLGPGGPFGRGFGGAPVRARRAARAARPPAAARPTTWPWSTRAGTCWAWPATR